MNILRRLPRSQLFALLTAIAVAAGVVSAVAVAAFSGGPVPPPKPLPNAIHAALAAPALNGISARISFTNHLIDSSSLQGVSGADGNPLLNGASGRLWASNDGRLRLELQSSRGDAQLLVDKNSFSFYDVSSNTVYRGQLPASFSKHDAQSKPDQQMIPTVKRITDFLKRLSGQADVSGATPTDVAGQPAYSVRISPKHSGGLLGSAELAWDATHGVPLRAAIYASNSPSPVLELTATSISFGPVPASDFAVSAPSNAKVVNVKLPNSARAVTHGRDQHKRAVTGPNAVRAAVPFSLVAPNTLVGLPRTSVRELDLNGKPSALITYGQHLGAIVVLERAVQADKGAAQSSAHRRPAAGNSSDGNSSQLPTVSINGATGTELATALGTLVHFDRGGVSYTVLGSIPPAAAEAAARGL